MLPSVVNVSQLRTIDRSRLGERIGILGPARLLEVLQGLALLFGTDDVVESGI
ncbi:MAG: PemK-like, MazF-like toxin of type toxin-antitoxin system [Acidobacteriota bacterium]|nr:PemK-like, MazF-like toxin of type toxin-antitoxin system [Acidobacteriota bacterium]